MLPHVCGKKRLLSLFFVPKRRKMQGGWMQTASAVKLSCCSVYSPFWSSAWKVGKHPYILVHLSGVPCVSKRMQHWWYTTMYSGPWHTFCSFPPWTFILLMAHSYCAQILFPLCACARAQKRKFPRTASWVQNLLNSRFFNMSNYGLKARIAVRFLPEGNFFLWV